MAKKSSKKTTRRVWVVKVGSALFLEGGPLLVRSWISQILELKEKHKVDVIWVTSGAIASARMRVKRSHTSLPEKQALSAIGQPLVMDLYNLALQAVGLLGAQVLLTYDDMTYKSSRVNLRNTLEKLLEWGVVPILNENDAVSTEEIQFGDNDLLSAKVAALVEAERLVILTNVGGLYDKNPFKHPDAKLISHLKTVSKSLLASTDQNEVSAVGRGGMFSKLRAAQFARQKGIPAWIVSGEERQSLVRIASGEAIGTQVGLLDEKKGRRK